MGKQRAGSMSKTRYRNLKQNQGLTDDEFEDLWENKVKPEASAEEYEERIQARLDEFAQDYDIDDMKINDKINLRLLAQKMITMEDYEKAFAILRAEHGIDLSKVVEFEKINTTMVNLSRSIAELESNLGITRKIRKGDKETSVISELERIKQAAKEFYEQKMFYVFCPKCKMLLSTTWFLFPEDKNNKMQLVCHRKLDNGEECGEKVQVTSADLLKSRGVNVSGIPEFFT